ncbi:MAG: GAF domain-containing sensor histidine kinase [Elusimicrobia bacterium]|nr:GAF domain-containing sensor histidine kinase [Elusimicrobiota bacterium]
MPPESNLELLLEVGRLLSSKLELSELLTTVMELSSRVVGAESASLLLLDGATQELYFDVALGLGEETSKVRLKLGQGIAGSVAQEGKPLIIPEVRKDSRWSPSMDEQSGFVTRSILAAPMILKGRVMGVIEAINHIEGPFTSHDLKTFEAFASQAAVAIENARLFSFLKEEKRKLHAVFSQMGDGAVLTDSEGLTLLINEAARDYLDPQTHSFRSLQEGFKHMEVSPPIAQILMSRDRVIPFELTRDKPKKLILAGNAIRLQSTGNSKESPLEGWLWIFRDVTAEKQEEKLTRSFLSLISHKLKTPLASITGYSQMLLEDKGHKGAEINALALDIIHKQGHKLADLVEKLLDFVTLEELNPDTLQKSHFDLGQVTQETVASMKPWLEEHSTTVAFGMESKSCAVSGDPHLIQGVLHNLIENAVKFNPKPQKAVSLLLQKNGAVATLSVADNGPGIPPEEQKKIFQRFYQVEASFTGQVEGWGLGLPFCKKVLETHKGNLQIKSQLNQGTTFTLTLPLVGEG